MITGLLPEPHGRFQLEGTPRRQVLLRLTYSAWVSLKGELARRGSSSSCLRMSRGSTMSGSWDRWNRPEADPLGNGGQDVRAAGVVSIIPAICSRLGW